MHTDREEVIRGCRNIVFDLDGTLYPGRVLRMNLFFLFLCHPVAVLKFHKARKKMRRTSNGKEGRSREDFIRRQAEAAGVSAEYFERKIYRAMEKRFALLRSYRRVRESLEKLKAAGIGLYVYSDFPIENKISEMHLEGLFDAVLCSEDSGFLKPERRSFDYLAAKTGIDAQSTLFVGDRHDTDEMFAKNSGMKFALVKKQWKWL